MNKSSFIAFGKRINWYQRVFNRNCQSQKNEVIEKHFPTPTIPVRIKRGPTNILKALAGTVGRDPTAPAYIFHDDPYLYSFSMTDKKRNALSKESGKKAAKWIRDKHPELFSHQPDDPVIKDFIPKITYNEESDVSESDLLYCINNVHVSDAICVYRLCKDKNIELSIDVRQSLLELVSFYNSEDTLDEEWVQERLNEEEFSKFKKVKSWKNGGFAEELFNNLVENGSEPYCAIIRGMNQHGEHERAWQLYQETLKKNLVLDTETFNSIIKCAVHLEQTNDLKFALIEEILAEMIKLKLPPNLGTLNAVLESLAQIRYWKMSDTISLQVLSEFRSLNIEPSLATYYYLLLIYQKFKTKVVGILPKILDKIEKKTFEVRDVRDTDFFYTAMEICLKDLKCFHTATRLHNFLLLGDNIKFIGGFRKDIIYKRSYFIMAMDSMSMEEFMKLYDDWVPNFYSPSHDIMQELIRIISLTDNLKHLPRIWSDCILLNLARSEDLVKTTLCVLNQLDLENLDKELTEKFVNIAWNMWETYKSQKGGPASKDWAASTFGDCLSVFVQCNDMEKARQLFNAAITKPEYILGVIPLTTLKNYFDALVSKGLYNQIKLILRYCKDNGFEEGDQWAENLYKMESTPENVKSELKPLVSPS